MGRLTEEDRAEIATDALLHGTPEAARMHGTSERHVAKVVASLAGGSVSDAGNVSPKMARDILKRRIREAQLKASLAIADAQARAADDDESDAQRVMALAAASRTYAEIEQAHEWLDEQLQLVEEQRAKLRARETTHDEVPQLESGTDGQDSSEPGQDVEGDDGAGAKADGRSP